MKLETSHDAPQITSPTLLQWQDWMEPGSPQADLPVCREKRTLAPLGVHGSSAGMENPAGPGLDAPGYCQGDSTPAPRLALRWHRAVRMYRMGVLVVTAVAVAQEQEPYRDATLQMGIGEGVCARPGTALCSTEQLSVSWCSS